MFESFKMASSTAHYHVVSSPKRDSAWISHLDQGTLLSTELMIISNKQVEILKWNDNTTVTEQKLFSLLLFAHEHEKIEIYFAITNNIGLFSTSCLRQHTRVDGESWKKWTFSSKIQQWIVCFWFRALSLISSLPFRAAFSHIQQRMCLFLPPRIKVNIFIRESSQHQMKSASHILLCRNDKWTTWITRSISIMNFSSLNQEQNEKWMPLSTKFSSSNSKVFSCVIRAWKLGRILSNSMNFSSSRCWLLITQETRWRMTARVSNDDRVRCKF